jgi:hypothetical protein
MKHHDVPPAPSGNDQRTGGLQVELSEADLESVVGGLARPWTEAEPDEWILESVKSAL